MVRRADDGSRQIRLQTRAVLDAHESRDLRTRSLRADHAIGSLRAGQRSPNRGEQDSRRSRGRVGDNRVVDDVYVQSVDQGDSSAIPAGYVVRDDVVGNRRRVPLCWVCREREHVRAVDCLQAQAAAAAGFRGVAHDQVGIDDQVGTNAVAGRTEECRIQTINVDRATAIRIDIGRAHDEETAAVGRDGRVETLVEQDRVVFDVAVVAESQVSDAAAVTAAQIAADPVVVELVVVGAGADAHAASPRRGAGEQLVAGGRVQRDIVVMNVDVQVLAVWQLRTEYRAELAGGRRVGDELSRCTPDGEALLGHDGDRYGELTLAKVDAARERSGIAVNPVVGDLQVMVPAVDEDAAATLRTLSDGQPIDARRVAHEVTGVGVRNDPAIGTLGPQWGSFIVYCCWNILEEQGVFRKRAIL